MKYGDIFSLFVGRTPVVVINSYDLIKSTFERMEFSGRPGNFSGTFFQKGKTGISTTEGKHWKAQREFLINHLDHLTGLYTSGGSEFNLWPYTGAGSKALEDVVLDEVTDLKMGFAKKEGEALAISYKMNVGILNILWNVTCGRKLHAQQQEFQVKGIRKFITSNLFTLVCLWVHWQDHPVHVQGGHFLFSPNSH